MGWCLVPRTPGSVIFQSWLTLRDLLARPRVVPRERQPGQTRHKQVMLNHPQSLWAIARLPDVWRLKGWCRWPYEKNTQWLLAKEPDAFEHLHKRSLSKKVTSWNKRIEKVINLKIIKYTLLSRYNRMRYYSLSTNTTYLMNWFHTPIK